MEDDLESQMDRFFAGHSSNQVSELTTYSAYPCHLRTETKLSVIVFFLGINDVCNTLDEDDIPSLVEKLMDAAHDLYVKAGARNYLFIDIPPVDRSPGCNYATTLPCFIDSSHPL